MFKLLCMSYCAFWWLIKKLKPQYTNWSDVISLNWLRCTDVFSLCFNRPVAETTGKGSSGPLFTTVCMPVAKPQELSVYLSLLACSRNHRNPLVTSVCWPVTLTETTGTVFTSVCWPVPKTTGTLCSPQFAGLLQKPRGPLFTSVYWPVTEATGPSVHLLFAGLLQKPWGPPFTSVCWPVAEMTGNLCLLAFYRSHRALCSALLACCRSHRALCSALFAGLLQKPQGPLFSSVCWPVAEATGPSVQLCLLACCRSHRALCSPLFAGPLQKPQGPLFTSVCWPIAETTGEGGSGQQLKEHLVDELDYVLVPAEAWNKLVAWYTLMPGQVCSRQQNGCSLCGWPRQHHHQARGVAVGRRAVDCLWCWQWQRLGVGCCFCNAVRGGGVLGGGLLTATFSVCDTEWLTDRRFGGCGGLEGGIDIDGLFLLVSDVNSLWQCGSGGSCWQFLYC